MNALRVCDTPASGSTRRCGGSPATSAATSAFVRPATTRSTTRRSVGVESIIAGGPAHPEPIDLSVDTFNIPRSSTALRTRFVPPQVPPTPSNDARRAAAPRRVPADLDPHRAGDRRGGRSPLPVRTTPPQRVRRRPPRTATNPRLRAAPAPDPMQNRPDLPAALGVPAPVSSCGFSQLIDDHQRLDQVSSERRTAEVAVPDRCGGRTRQSAVHHGTCRIATTQHHVAGLGVQMDVLHGRAAGGGDGLVDQSSGVVALAARHVDRRHVTQPGRSVDTTDDLVELHPSCEVSDRDAPLTSTRGDVAESVVRVLDPTLGALESAQFQLPFRRSNRIIETVGPRQYLRHMAEHPGIVARSHRGNDVEIDGSAGKVVDPLAEHADAELCRRIVLGQRPLGVVARSFQVREHEDLSQQVVCAIVPACPSGSRRATVRRQQTSHATRRNSPVPARARGRDPADRPGRRAGRRHARRERAQPTGRQRRSRHRPLAGIGGPPTWRRRSA